MYLASPYIYKFQLFKYKYNVYFKDVLNVLIFALPV